MNRCAAEIVNEKLREIADRKEAQGSQPGIGNTSTDDVPESAGFVPFNFDEIEPYENEPPK